MQTKKRLRPKIEQILLSGLETREARRRNSHSPPNSSVEVINSQFVWVESAPLVSRGDTKVGSRAFIIWWGGNNPRDSSTSVRRYSCADGTGSPQTRPHPKILIRLLDSMCTNSSRGFRAEDLTVPGIFCFFCSSRIFSVFPSLCPSYLIYLDLMCKL